MESHLKKIAEAVIGIIAAAALLLLVGEAESTSMQLLSFGGAAAILYVCYRILNRMGVFDETN